MNASIVVLTYNNLEKCTKKCIETILNSTDLYNNELIIVDNNSQDSTVFWLDELLQANSDKNIHIIKNQENLGYAGGNNVGIKKSKGDFIILLNNDTEVCENWVENLTSSFNEDRALGIVAPITNRIGSLQQVSVPNLNSQNWINVIKPYTRMMKGRSFFTSKVCFFCVCIPRHVIEKVGLLDPNYERGNFEDDDYCLRAIRNGFKIRVNEDLFIYHHGSLSFSGFSENDLQATNLKNQRFFEKKHSISYSFVPLIKEFSSYCNELRLDDTLSYEEKCQCLLYHRPIVDIFKSIENSSNARKERAFTGVLTLLRSYLHRIGIFDLKNRLTHTSSFIREYGLRSFILKHRSPIKVEEKVDVRLDDIPIYILSFNRLECLKLLLERLRQMQVKNPITIIDNNSTYPPLLEFYKTCGVTVIKLKKNYGHLAIWKCEAFRDVVENDYYIYTDSDVVPTKNCPKNFIEVFFQLLRTHPFLTKVGFSLSLENIPDNYKKKDEVKKWESKFWSSEKKFNFSPSVEFFDAPIDTTLALYRPGIYPYESKWWRSVRTAPPYAAEHLGWYPEYILKDEMLHYQGKFRIGSSHWLKDTTVEAPKEALKK